MISQGFKLLTGLVVGIVCVTACGDPYEKSSPAETTKAAEMLENRPPLEDAVRELEQAMIEIGAAITASDPSVRWSWSDTLGTIGCQPPFDQTEGMRALLRFYHSRNPIPDEVWPRAVEVTRNIAAQFGATDMQVFQDKPNNHDVRFSSADGTVIGIGSQVAATITARTGCHVPGPGWKALLTSTAKPTSPAPR